MDDIEKVDAETTEKESGGVEETKDTESEEDADKEIEKPKESSEDKLARLERQAKQLRKKLGKEEPVKSEPKKADKKSDEFDEGQLAYLVAKGIDSDEDIDFTRDELKKHGGTLRELLGNDYFKAKLTARKDAKTTLEATPTGSRRSGSKASDSLDYHFAKYEKEGGKYLMTLDRETRTKIVNARLKKAKDNNQFTDEPVVGN